MGDEIGEDQAKKDCDPIIYNKDVKEPLLAADGATTLTPNDIAYPCGLIAKSVFTDSYQLFEDDQA